MIATKHQPTNKNHNTLTMKRKTLRGKKVDWSMKSAAIAKKYDMTRSEVVQWRLALAPETTKGRGSKQAERLRRVDWAAIDWTRPTSYIAAELHCTTNTILVKRRIYAPDAVKGQCGRKPSTNWDAIDWSRSNADIAAEIEVQPATVQFRRRRHTHKTTTTTTKR